jgi:ABC-type glycerol-3-phosphate transport system permease component
MEKHHSGLFVYYCWLILLLTSGLRLLALMPAVIFYLMAQKYIIAGVTSWAVKG